MVEPQPTFDSDSPETRPVDLVNPPAYASSRWGWLAAAAFPVVLWAFATYTTPDLGKWADDYLNVMRDPTTGVYNPNDVWGFVVREMTDSYRPLHHALVGLKATFLWNHWWLNHLMNVVTHGLAAWLGFVLIRRLTRTWHAAAAAALVFTVHPLGHQVILCSSGQPTSIATVTFLLIALLYIGFAEGRRGWPSVVLMTLLAYTVPTWQEQPATNLVALPLLYLAVCPATEPWRRRLVRAVVPAGLCCLAVFIYVVLWQLDVGEGSKGGPGSWVKPDELPERVQTVLEDGYQQYRMHDILEAGFPIGWQQLGNVYGLTWIVALAAALVLWWPRWQRRPIHDPPARPIGFSSQVLVVAYAVLGYLLAWLPLFLQRVVSVEPRMAYFPLLLALLAVAVGLDVVLRLLGHSRLLGATAKLALGLALVWTCLYLAVCLVAMQHLYRRRYDIDQRHMATLKQRIPDPKPGTVFIPLEVKDAPVATGRTWFDHTVRSAIEMPWVVNPIVQQTFKRRDVYMTHYMRWYARPYSRIDASGVVYEVDRYLAGDFEVLPDGGVRLPWETVVPYVVDKGNQLHVVSKIVLRHGAKADQEIVIDQAARALEKAGLPQRSYALASTRAYEGMQQLTGWRWLTTGEAAEVETIKDWDMTLPSIAMHPVFPGNKNQAALAVTLEPSTQPSRLHFRAGITQWTIENRPWGDGMRFTWYFKGNKDEPLATLAVTPQRTQDIKQWMPVTIDLPPLSVPKELIVEVDAGPKGNADYDGCRLMAGYRERLPAATGPAASKPATSLTRPTTSAKAR